MTTVDGLLVLVAFVYLVECAAWVRRDVVPFRMGWRGRWRHAPPAEWGGHDKNAFVLAGPLPPLPPLILTQLWPLSLSPDGLLSYAAASAPDARRLVHARRFLPWSEVTDVRIDGKSVRIGGERFAEFVSPLLADRVGGLLEEMARLAEKDRELALRRALRESFDAKAAAAAAAEARERAGGLAWACNLLLLVLFGVGPAAFHVEFLTRRWPIVVLWIVGFWALVLYEFARAHRAMHQGATGERRRHFWMMLLSPLAALRARDVVVREALVLWHPLAAAKALLPAAEFARFARRMLADAQHPVLPVGPFADARAASTEAWYRACLIEEMERFLRHEAHDPRALLAPPERDGASSRSYCERCDAQYTMPEGACDACGGRPLRSFGVPV